MNCLNVDAQINLEMVNNLLMEYSFPKKGFYWDIERRESTSPQDINNIKVNLTIHHIQAVHVKMRIEHFWSYLSQILMDFAQIWFILKLIQLIRFPMAD